MRYAVPVSSSVFAAALLVCAPSFAQTPPHVVDLRPAQPVYVTNIPEGVTRLPVGIKFFARQFDTSAGQTYMITDLNFTVPDGTRLVIEYVDATIWLGNFTNTGKAIVELNASRDGQFFRHPMGMVEDSINCTLTQTCLYVNRETKVYLEAGFRLTSDVLITASEASSLGHIMEGTINGYLEEISSAE